MQRSISVALAAALAVGTAVTTLGPAQAAPLRALPTIANGSATGIQPVHDRRHDRWHRHHRHYPQHTLRFGVSPFFSFSVPYASPRYERDYRPYYRQRYRPNQRDQGWYR